MPYSFRTRNADGTVHFSSTKNLSRVIAHQTVAKNSSASIFDNSIRYLANGDRIYTVALPVEVGVLSFYYSGTPLGFPGQKVQLPMKAIPHHTQIGTDKNGHYVKASPAHGVPTSTSRGSPARSNSTVIVFADA
jgi:hypothetical protein